VPAARDLLHDAEHRADGHVDVDVRRAVEGIEQQAVLAALEVLGDRDDPLDLLRRHRAEPAAMVDGLDDRLVGEDVELLLDLALTFASLVAPRMSTRPARRTLLAIIFAASARS
jgi:hypothetical protein